MPGCPFASLADQSTHRVGKAKHDRDAFQITFSNVTATPNVKLDIFALGSAIYYIMTGREPYDTLTDAEVAARYSGGDFPAVDLIPYEQIILGCWRGRFNSADKVFRDLVEKRKAVIITVRQQSALLRNAEQYLVS